MMKTPSLRMIAAGCFGPGICRTRAIWFFKDVKRARKANSACDLAVNLRRGVGRNPPQGAT
jgi:hypothetical protein